MFTIALIGPDGSGKTTISERLLQDLPVPVKRIYMGINRGESNVALPTTHFLNWLDKLRGRKKRGGPRNPEIENAKPIKNPIIRSLKGLKSALLLVNRLADESYRYMVTGYYLRRGMLVIFDRHFFLDYYHYDIQAKNRAWTNRVHAYFLEHVFPKPDVVIFLDAPAEVLFSRKGEGSIELLEARRQQYLSLQAICSDFIVVDASQTIDKTVAAVQQLLMARIQASVENVSKIHG